MRTSSSTVFRALSKPEQHKVRREARRLIVQEHVAQATNGTVALLRKDERKRKRISVQALETWIDRRTNEFKTIKRWEMTRRTELGGQLTQQQEDLIALARTETLYLLKYDKWLLSHRQFDRKGRLTDDFKWVTLRRESSAKTLAKVLVLLGLKQKPLEDDTGDIALTLMRQQQAARARPPAAEESDGE